MWKIITSYIILFGYVFKERVTWFKDLENKKKSSPKNIPENESLFLSSFKQNIIKVYIVYSSWY